MTDAVADGVLDGSYTQTQAMSLALLQSRLMVEVHGRLIRHLEQVAGLDREIEFLPSEEALAARRTDRRGPHRSRSWPRSWPTARSTSTSSCWIPIFPRTRTWSPIWSATSRRRCASAMRPQMREHRLRRELIATLVANQLVDRAGMTFAFRLGEETGAAPAQLARAYAVAREVFSMREFWAEVEALDNRIEAGTQLSMLIEGRQLVERAARWLVRSLGARRDRRDRGHGALRPRGADAGGRPSRGAGGR